jgi:anti-sigma factor ChrR (cupin superfamily)
MAKAIVAALLLTALPAAAVAMDDHIYAIQAGSMKWNPSLGLPKGAEVALVYGDPRKEGPYVIRARLPADYKIPPHWHPTAENVTVLSGVFHIAMGDTFDTAKGEAVEAGGFFTAETGMHHYGWTTGPTVIQVHGQGPFSVNYINPADDPNKK